MMKYFLALILSFGIMCSSTAAVGEGIVFCSSEEFSEKMTRFSSVFQNSTALVPSGVGPLEKWSEAERSGTTLIPIPERGAFVHPIQQDHPVRLETAGLYACVGIAAWNTKNIGCVHWDLGPKPDDLQKFVNDLTDQGQLNSETKFVLHTNFLSKRLEDAHKFLLENVPGSQIFLEATHALGGYVIFEDFPYLHFYDQKDKSAHFDPETNKKKYAEKGISIRSNFAEGEVPYSFTVTDVSDRLQDYFMHLDTSFSEQKDPRDYWSETYPSHKDTEPTMLWKMAEKLHKSFVDRDKRLQTGKFGSRNTSCRHENLELIYLYD